VLAYFVLAAWSIRFHDDFTPPGRVVIRTYRPFQKLGGSQYIAEPYDGPTFRSIEALNGLADTLEDNQRSPVLIYENNRPLGPAHSLHADISNLGRGRYSHWKGEGVRFSTSDNSDPNTNDRYYWIVVPW
jgi:hypothetical protein